MPFPNPLAYLHDVDSTSHSPGLKFGWDFPCKLPQEGEADWVSGAEILARHSARN